MKGILLYVTLKGILIIIFTVILDEKEKNDQQNNIRTGSKRAAVLMCADERQCIFVYATIKGPMMEIFDGDTEKLGAAAGLVIMMAYLGWHLLGKK